MNYSFLALQNYPPSMHPRGSIYSPPIEKGGSSHVSRRMEGQESIYSGLVEENSKSFCFMHISRCMRATMEQDAYTRKY